MIQGISQSFVIGDGEKEVGNTFKHRAVKGERSDVSTELSARTNPCNLNNCHSPRQPNNAPLSDARRLTDHRS